ncbi:uncharacterized protein MYCGRDRAFT_51771 [Zymoseptoria tritici IPO323]|uniref:Uncharacterized protein n=1 Tax=Zymoseptoria tritici (strain CBS 115943 / IPO323) TaxID=336722 RepID=F9XRY9_ZYMTI|nr:uncharacterized protein MYCGRDRAFT_51771 [Zymoseptoria tritici IPO323]EGP82002.1 hypothetical protein MYCGRDRAFT_51771 [Zymoseptoria tritici IPO323]
MKGRRALYDICMRTLKLNDSSYGLVSAVMSVVTACLRFSGQLNSDLRKLAVNTPYFVPLFRAISSRSYISRYSPFISRYSPSISNSRYLTYSAIYRGKVSIKEVED